MCFVNPQSAIRNRRRFDALSQDRTPGPLHRHRRTPGRADRRARGGARPGGYLPARSISVDARGGLSGPDRAGGIRRLGGRSAGSGAGPGAAGARRRLGRAQRDDAPRADRPAERDTPLAGGAIRPYLPRGRGRWRIAQLGGERTRARQPESRRDARYHRRQGGGWLADRRAQDLDQPRPGAALRHRLCRDSHRGRITQTR